ncbi:MAG: hypothetical protein ABS95_00945 [Verrucomicrobia bacterium SCN 57-15]|nr:MAG: hypothetical protein ABS95_00945 [Verrucomicrobia bacterium SCN 57-15]
MKTTTTLLALSAGILFLASASTSNAQFRATGDDGITASPKYRQFLNERGRPMVKGAKPTTVASVGYQPTGRDGITASPKLRQFINESRGVESTPGTVVVKVGYRPTGDDGITASPKFRQFLDEHKSSYQVAPLK